MGIKSIQSGCPCMLRNARLVKISLFKKGILFSVFLQILDSQHEWVCLIKDHFLPSLPHFLSFFLLF